MFDIIIKLLSDTYGPAVVGFFQAQLGLPVGGPFEFVPGSLPQVTVEADRVFRVDRPGPMLIHTEWESSSHLGRPERFLEYNVLLRRHTGLPVKTVAILLRKEAVSSDLTGHLMLRLPTGEPYHEFWYAVIRLWEIPPAVFLADPGLTPFAPLGAVSEAELPALALAREMEARWAGLDRKEAGGLLTAAKVLMGARYSTTLIHGLFKEFPTMKESVIYQEILQEGREEGLTKGNASGRLVEGRDRLLHLGGRRFGATVAASRPQVEAIDDLDRLHRMFDRAIDAPDWAAVLATE